MKWVGSPNFSPGRNGRPIQLIVVHWIVGRLAAADSVFKNPAAKTSAHYAIGNTAVHQYVKESDTAWHAGNFDINLGSIGIEHEGGPNLPISDATYETSAKLIADICTRYRLNPDTAVKPHRNYIGTQCPGSLDLGRLINRAKQFMISGSMATVTISTEEYRDLKGWKELGIVLQNERDKTLYPMIEDFKNEISILKRQLAQSQAKLTPEEAAALKGIVDKLIGV